MVDIALTFQSNVTTHLPVYRALHARRQSSWIIIWLVRGYETLERFLTCTADGGQTMCNDEYSTPLHDALQGLLYQMLTLCIQCTVTYKAYCIVSAQLAS